MAISLLEAAAYAQTEHITAIMSPHSQSGVSAHFQLCGEDGFQNQFSGSLLA